ncbi:hypothetical protein [Streptomyces violens]|uniref:hypothetical protein n=1 Tax=Streptomyces violens TaxID=66377 RepID=UPI0004BF36B3|nr:hypothetical protein [Streptomyces violens]
MIRLITRARLLHLAAAVDAARARTREVEKQADAAYGSHIRETFALTARAEAAEKTAETTRQEVRSLQITLEDTAAELAEARTELADMAKRLKELSQTPADASMWLLLHYGEPHSIHPGQSAAFAYVATLGVPLSNWGPMDERPVAEVRWRCVPFIYDVGRDHFQSVIAPAVEPSGGAR